MASESRAIKTFLVIVFFFFLNITHLDSTVALLCLTEREAAAVIIRVAGKELWLNFYNNFGSHTCPLIRFADNSLPQFEWHLITVEA